jgi:hypothetical protein
MNKFGWGGIGKVWKRAFGQPGQPLDHRIAQTKRKIDEEGLIRRSGLFDEQWFRRQNSIFLNGEENLIKFYLENVYDIDIPPHPLFDNNWYISQADSIRSSGLSPLGHYILTGAAQNLSPHPLFDPIHYRIIRGAAITRHVNVLHDFVVKGYRLGVSPHLCFDSMFYYEQVPNLREQDINPLTHFVVVGHREGIEPNRCFDTVWYRSMYLADADIDVNPLIHFVQVGAAARINPHPEIDIAHFIRKYATDERDWGKAYQKLLASALSMDELYCADSETAARPKVPVSGGTSEPVITSVWTNPELVVGPDVAVFVHYDSGRRVRPYVLAYLQALRQAGFAIAFASNAGHVIEADAEQLRGVCAAIVMRRNVGYDFAAMRDAIQCLGLPHANTDRLLIVNDSVYGPLRPIDEMLSQVDFARADVWGATDSWQERYHLQSFFLVFGRKALTSRAWRAFWNQVRDVDDKAYVISKYEVGLTQRLLAAGLSCAALFPYSMLVADVDDSLVEVEDSKTDPMANARRIQSMRIRHAAAESRPLNPTADLWRQLLLAGFPFIKRELLRANPSGVTDIADCRGLARSLGLDTTLIEEDLRLVLRHRAP